MTELLKLAERCEATTGPSDELQFAIGDAVGATIERAPFDGAGRGVRDCPPYTHSLDAAMTLVPEGWRVVNFAESEPDVPPEELRQRPWTAMLKLPADDFRAKWAKAYAATPALALCAAALRAIAPEQSA